MDKKPNKLPIREIAVLERLRKEIIANKPRRTFFAIAMTFASVFVFIPALLDTYLDHYYYIGRHDGFIFVIGLIGFLVICHFIFKYYYDEAEKDDKYSFIVRYKDFYLKRYVNSLGFNYSKYGTIGLNDIHFSHLFLPFQLHGGNDLITGEIDNVEFKFCDLLLKRKTGTTQDGEAYGVVIFQGLLFVAKFNKQIKGRILVMPKNIISKSGYKKIKMDNSEFNDTFNVFTTDLQNAMYVLTPALMDRILELKKIMKCPISLSFLYDRIFIKIDKGYDSFEPDLNKSIVSTNIARHIKIELDAMFNIVKILKLNNRIWTIKN